MRRRVRWGVLGTANIALERTIPALAQIDNAECVAIASRDGVKAQKAAAALAHEFPNGSEEDILSEGLDLVLKEHAKRKALVEKPRQRSKLATSNKSIPAGVIGRVNVARSPTPRDRMQIQFRPQRCRREACRAR